MRRKKTKDYLPVSEAIRSGRTPMARLVHLLAAAEYLNICHAAKALAVVQSSVSARFIFHLIVSFVRFRP